MNYPVLAVVSNCCPSLWGRLPTCYSPVCHWVEIQFHLCASTLISLGHSVRLACLRHAASVHPEPGSNSPKKLYFYIIYFVKLISDFEFKNWRFAQFSKIISACLSSALPIYHLIIGKSSTFCIFIRPFFSAL